jgi:hypothetical protein
MKELIEQIRVLLASLEHAATQADQAMEFQALSGLELPDILCDVVDLLLPELKSLDAMIYIHLLRHSIVASGTPYVRTSQNRLKSAIKPNHVFQKTSGEISFVALRDALTRLEAIGAIRVEGEPNREGTLYRILLPEEIKVCRRRRAERFLRPIVETGDADPDFYNIRENRLKIYERDDYHCAYCMKQLTRFTATLDHVTPVREGGDNSAANLKTACLQCNSRKTARPLGDFLAERFPT